MTARSLMLSAPQLAEYLDCRDASGNPDTQAIIKLSADGSLPPPDVRRPGGEVYWYRKTINNFIDTLTGAGANDYSPLLIDGGALAKMLGVTAGWVKNHRYNIIGAQRIGGPRGPWRYNLEVIRGLIMSGKDIIDSPVGANNYSPLRYSPSPLKAKPRKKIRLKN